MEQMIFLAVKIFMLDSAQESDPDLQPNRELIEALESDCDLIEANMKALNYIGYTMGMENENRDLMLEHQFSLFELRPDSVLFSIFSHVSSIEFRAEDDLVIMKTKYENIFL